MPAQRFLPKEQVRIVCVLIVINAVVSFRSVPRILQQLVAVLHMPLFKVPCYNSVINWTMRYGVHLLSSVSKVAEAWFAIIDMSIETGKGKALVVLRVPVHTWNERQKRQQSLLLEDCEAIGVDVRPDWNADSVSASLTEIFGKAGKPIGIVKDQGSDLSAGSKTLNLPDMQDIGHKAGNALKGKFANDKWFKSFVTLVAKFGSRLRQSKWAHLTPPKIRTMGRFQSISRVVEWAERILAFYAESHKAEGETFAHLFRKLRVLERPLARLAHSCKIVNDIQQLMKTRGLNPESAVQVRAMLARLSRHCPVKRNLTIWLERQLQVFEKLSITHPELLSLPVSSDVIESLFGRFKHILARQPRPELGQLTVMIAALCGKHSPTSVESALLRTKTHELELMRGNHFPHSVERKRREFLRKTDRKAGSAAPKHGTLKNTA